MKEGYLFRALCRFNTPEVRGVRLFFVHGPFFHGSGHSALLGFGIIKTRDSLWIDLLVAGRLFRWLLLEWWT